MYRVLGALAGGQKRSIYSPSGTIIQALQSACCLLDPGSNLITSTCVYATASSYHEAEHLSAVANQLADEHHLTVVIQFCEGRLRVKFRPLAADLGAPSGR